MTPKYYTPEISEFHVGFEYEFNSIVPDENNWQKAIIKDGTQIDDIHRKYKNGNRVYALRVKHLDREDIESLGFVFENSSNEREIFERYRFTGGYLEFWYNYNSLFINSDAHKNRGSFTGTIKNKSELKKLMVQLGIN